MLKSDYLKMLNPLTPIREITTFCAKTTKTKPNVKKCIFNTVIQFTYDMASKYLI